MSEQFLHEQLEIAFNFGVPKPEMPDGITQNLNPAFELRPYQEDAFASFIHYFNNDLSGKEKPLHHLLYDHPATTHRHDNRERKRFNLREFRGQENRPLVR